MICTTALLATLFLAAPVAAEDTPRPGRELRKAQKKLAKFLDRTPGASTGTVTPLTADGVPETFPDHVLFALRFRQFPVAVAPPEPFASSNVVAVPKGRGRPVLITDTEQLQAFFAASARAVTTDDEAGTAVRAWLRAVAELNQDGFYQFTVEEKVEVTTKKDTTTAAGRVTVARTGGNRGGITATLTFRKGALVAADTNVSLSPGPRPICQATKLLDPDPVVRRMAEDAVRMMGSAAKPYLADQRAAAAPELKAAIDAVWKRIVAEGR